MNIVVMQGRPTADLELKYTATTNKPVTSFCLAVKRPFTAEKTDFINCVCFDKKAEVLCKYVGKGALINVQGSLQSRKFEDKNGNTRTAFEVIVTDFDFCEKKGGTDVNMSVDPLDAFKDNLAKNNVPTGKTDFEEIIDDDILPF